VIGDKGSREGSKRGNLGVEVGSQNARFVRIDVRISRAGHTGDTESSTGLE
jgi:CO dehydrogenase/acetyl-CoA synthase alpha subunit